MLPRPLRLKNTLLFQKAFRYGKPFFFGNIGARIVFRSGSGRKFGFIATKKMFRRAVDRNTVRRILSEAVFLIQDSFPEDASIVLFLRNRPEEIRFDVISDDIKGLVRGISSSFPSKRTV
ncbi:MAG: ribonuclease P protein component [Candidatus Moraniibacteriota bacterium]